ncbi:MAG: hypothetical protein R3342_01815 [Lutibacter sp.]|uniref:hypothetical protein n=1 Tax=Lutibacter sp. TaxID=1925666 RepID=UPI00299CD827|nr:hypothetical protein [Lutibacter sp.]MDX1828259.1 hypothetical protein [Lutibacter sp.]
MKKLITLFILFVLSINLIQAQQMQRQRIKALKTSYITNALNLTPKEAEKFWPVYNLYTQKIQDLKMDSEMSTQKQIRLAGSIDNITNEQAKKLIAKSLKNQQKITDAKFSMVKELSSIISSKKILLLQKTERNFNRKMLQELGKRRRMMQGQ